MAHYAYRGGVGLARTGPLAVVAVAAVLLAAPAPAGAASVGLVPDAASTLRLVYASAPGEANVLTVTKAGERIEFHDAGAAIDPGESCERIGGDPHRASCTYSHVVLRLGDGADRAQVTLDRAGWASLHFQGGDGNDSLTATAETIAAYGGEGDDALDVDAYQLSGSSEAAREHPDGRREVLERVDYGLYGEGGNDRLDASRTADTNGPAALNGGPGDDTIAGTWRADWVNAGDGDDTVTVGADEVEDVVDGGPGLDTLSGGAHDQLRGEAGDDRLSATGIGGRLFGGQGDDTLDGGGGVDGPFPTSPTGGAQLDGGPGADTFTRGSVSYRDRTAPVTVIADGLPNDGEPGELDNVGVEIRGIAGGSGSDVLTGNALQNEIDGGDGDDVLTAGGGVRDVLFAGRGSDTILAMDGGLKTGPYRFPLLPEIDDQVFCDSPGDVAFVDAEDATGWGPPVRCATTYVADGLGTVKLPPLTDAPWLPLPVECPKVAGIVCNGTVELRLAVRKPVAKAAARPPRYVSPRSSPRLGTGRYSIRRAKRRTVKVKLSKSAERRLRGRRKAEVWVTFSRP